MAKSSSTFLLFAGCLTLAACGTTGQPSGTGTGAAATGHTTRDLTFSRCMRSHGVPAFPDPAFSSPRNAPRVLVLREMVFAIGPTIDPKSPAFRRAAAACGVNTATA
jgi:hypothetical protein